MIKHSIIIMILLPKRIFVERLTLYRMDIAPGKELPHFKDYNITSMCSQFSLNAWWKQQICYIEYILFLFFNEQQSALAFIISSIVN